MRLVRRVLAVVVAVLLSGCALPAPGSGDDVSPLAAETPASAQAVGQDYARLGRIANVRLSLQRYGGVVSEEMCQDAWRNLRAQPRWAALPDQPPSTFLQPCEQG